MQTVECLIVRFSLQEKQEQKEEFCFMSIILSLLFYICKFVKILGQTCKVTKTSFFSSRFLNILNNFSNQFMNVFMPTDSQKKNQIWHLFKRYSLLRNP